ncbi:MAG: VWA domain-containing protein [Deltaproteobacteria bacterium]|nr:VWA domain-containing protein [Deltaproteobacteria bacterium]
MVRRLPSVSFAGLGLLLLTAAGCIPDTVVNGVAAPDPNKITVFFPLDGLVQGRGDPGAVVDTTVKELYIASHPTGTNTRVPVRPNGSFSFALAASSNDVLEMAAVLDEKGLVRGAPAFIKVPVKRAEGDDFFCCRRGPSEGKCMSDTEEDLGWCADRNRSLPIAAPACADDSYCAPYSGQVIPISEGTFVISPPNENGQITIESQPGLLPPNRLVRVENRGLGAVGGTPLNFRKAAVTDEGGVVSMTFSAKGDDELVFRVYEQNGFFRSREHSQFVPDSLLAGLDITGVFPFKPLRPGTEGTVAVRLAPFGIDRRGICADSADDPALCFSGGRAAQGSFNGGLDYTSIDLVSFAFEGTPGPKPQPTPRDDDTLPNTKFTDGDVLSGPQLVALIIDNSQNAEAEDGEDLRFQAAQTFVSSLRARDRMMIVTLGTANGFRIENEIFDSVAQDPTGLRLIVDRITGEPSSGSAEIFRALTVTAQKLRSFGEVKRARVALITTAPPAGDPTSDAEFVTAFDALVPDDPLGLAENFATHVVSLPQGNDKLASYLESLAVFSGGGYTTVGTAEGFLGATADAAGLISGAFVLLYNVAIPCGVGKAAKVDITASVKLPGPDGAPQERTGQFAGYMEIKEAELGQCP